MATARAPDPAESAGRLRAAYYAREGLTHEQLESVANDFMNAFRGVLAKKLSRIDNAKVTWEAFSDAILKQLAHRRSPKSQSAFAYAITTPPPIVVQSRGWIQLSMPRDLNTDIQVELLWSIERPNVAEIIYAGSLQDLFSPKSVRASAQIEMATERIYRLVYDELATKAVAYRQTKL